MILIFLINIFINCFWILNFFSRLTSIHTKKWASSNATFQVIYILPRFLSVIIIPLIVFSSEKLLLNNKTIDINFYRFLILSEIVGLFIGILSLSKFFELFYKIILNNENKINLKQIASIYFKIFTIERNLARIANIRIKDIFKIKNKILFFTNFIFGLVLSMFPPLLLLLSFQYLPYRGTLISSIPMLVGIGVTLSLYFVEPRISYFTDLVYEEKFSLSDFNTILFDCVKGKILGCIFSILLFDIFLKISILTINLITK